MLEWDEAKKLDLKKEGQEWCWDEVQAFGFGQRSKVHLLSSRKAKTHTRHHFGDTDGSGTTNANAAVDKGCSVVFFALA